MGYEYHSFGDLHGLGAKVRDLAVKVTMSQSDSYGNAEVRANNDASRVEGGTSQPLVEGYQPPSSGRPDDHGNLRRYVQLMYAGIPDWFTAFSVPDPDTCKSMAERFYQTAVTLEPSLEVTQQGGKLSNPLLTAPISGTQPIKQTVNFILTHMKHWDGDAADAFEGYVKKLELSSQLQRQLAISLAITLEADLEIRRRMLTDIWEIGQKTVKVLESLDGWCGGKQAVVATLTSGAAIAGVLLTVASGGGAVVLAVEGVAAATTILGLASSETSKVEIGGATVPPVIESMRNAMTRLQETIGGQSGELAGCLQKLADQYRQVSDRLTVPAPATFTALGKAGVETLDKGKQFYDR